MLIINYLLGAFPMEIVEDGLIKGGWFIDDNLH